MEFSRQHAALAKRIFHGWDGKKSIKLRAKRILPPFATSVKLISRIASAEVLDHLGSRQNRRSRSIVAQSHPEDFDTP